MRLRHAEQDRMIAGLSTLLDKLHAPTYTNVSTSNGDANCVKLTASNLVITEDGLSAPNNWGTYTTNSGSPSDSGTGTVVTVSATQYTDTIASLAPGASAAFTFKRSIN